MSAPRIEPVATRTAVVVWVVLLAATAAASAVHGTGTAGLTVVLALTFLKVWLVGRYFMELHEAPVALRRAFDAYVVCVPLGLAVILWCV